MPGWGSGWAALWGLDGFPADSRVLPFVRGPLFSALELARAERTNAYVAACQDIAAAFDIDTATGDRLDALGTILQRPRLGASDDRYRVLLQIQIELILSSSTTTPTILRIVELFTGAAPRSYSEHYPSGYTVEATVDPADVDLLVSLLSDATSATYQLTLIAGSADALASDYTPASPTTGADALDYTPASPTAGAAPLSYEHSP